MSWEATTAVVKHCQGRPGEVLMLLVLANDASRHGHVIFIDDDKKTARKLAEAARCSRASFYNYVEACIERGELVRVPGVAGGTATYRITLPGLETPEEKEAGRFFVDPKAPKGKKARPKSGRGKSENNDLDPVQNLDGVSNRLDGVSNGLDGSVQIAGRYKDTIDYNSISLSDRTEHQAATDGDGRERKKGSAEDDPTPLTPDEAVTAAGARYAATMARLGFQVPENPERGCAARLRALVAEHGAEGFLERWDRVLATVEAVPFLRGEGAKWDHAPIGWLAEHEARVLAGEYGEAAKGEGKAAGPVSVSPGTAVRCWTVSGAWVPDLGPPPDDAEASPAVRDAAAAFAGPARQAIQTRNVCDLPSTGPVAAAQRRLCERVRNAPPSERDTIAARVAALESHNEEKKR